MSEAVMKTIITAALGFLVISAPLATAQTAAQARAKANERGFIQRAIQIKQQQEAQRRAYLNSPEYLRKQIAELQRQQNNDRFDAKRERNWQETQREVEAANQRSRARMAAERR
jgi:nitrate reductase cytochrome c-type subunit